MRFLASFIMTGRIHAAGMVLLFTFLSWLMPLVSLFAVAALALPTLRQGAREGGIIALIALAGLVIFGGYLLGSPVNALVYGLLLWGPAWVCASVWREGGRLSFTLLVAAALGVLAVLVAYAVLDNPAAFWTETFSQVAASALSQAPSSADRDEFLVRFQAFAAWLTGLIALGSVASLVLSLFMARWWQALLYNPGGFSAEFRQLTLPRSMAYALMGLTGLAMIAPEGIAAVSWNIIQPCLAPFIFGGFAVLHVWLGGRSFWLQGIYVLLLIVPYILLPILLLGFTDTLLNLRQRTGIR